MERNRDSRVNLALLRIATKGDPGPTGAVSISLGA